MLVGPRRSALFCARDGEARPSVKTKTAQIAVTKHRDQMRVMVAPDFSLANERRRWRVSAACRSHAFPRSASPRQARRVRRRPPAQAGGPKQSEQSRTCRGHARDDARERYVVCKALVNPGLCLTSPRGFPLGLVRQRRSRDIFQETPCSTRREGPPACPPPHQRATPSGSPQRLCDPPGRGVRGIPERQTVDGLRSRTADPTFRPALALPRNAGLIAP